MKQFLAYVHPQRRFDDETSRLVRLQIDNAYRLGWPASDILLATNFPYRYNGVTAIEVPDELRYDFDPLSNKIPVIAWWMGHDHWSHGHSDTFWYHDFDCYQIAPFDEVLTGCYHLRLRLGSIDGPKLLNLALTDYGWSEKWCLGSLFYDWPMSETSTWAFFAKLADAIGEFHLGDERALMKLVAIGRVPRCFCRRLNITYNVGKRHIEENVRRAEKPIRVLHFHPTSRNLRNFDRLELLPDGLRELFHLEGFL